MKLKWTWVGPKNRRTTFGDPYRLWIGMNGYIVRYCAKIDGVAVPPPRYSATLCQGTSLSGRTISRHKTKQAAMAACEKHARSKK